MWKELWKELWKERWKELWKRGRAALRDAHTLVFVSGCARARLPWLVPWCETGTCDGSMMFSTSVV